jgi:hypothetical protein
MSSKPKEAGSLTGQGRTVPQFAFSPNGQFLAFRTAFGEAKLYEIATKKLRTIDTGGFERDGLAFSPDGKVLASGGHKPSLFLALFSRSPTLGQAARTRRPTVLQGEPSPKEDARNGCVSCRSCAGLPNTSDHPGSGLAGRRNRIRRRFVCQPARIGTARGGVGTAQPAETLVSEKDALPEVYNLQAVREGGKKEERPATAAG